MIPRIVHKCWIFIWMLMGGFASAQPFQHKAGIDSVKQSGFYGISITPALSTFIKTDFSDLRIVDNTGNSVPYLLESDISWKDSSRFAQLKIVENKTDDSGRTVLILQNNPNERIDEFYIRVKNTAASRTINLSGSNDGVKWYSILENVNFEKLFILDNDIFQENMHFPLSTYTFYRMTIYNWKRDPLDIISVQKRIPGEFHVINDAIPNPPASFVRKDSSKITWLSINNAARFHISKILFRVKSPRFYKRQVDVIAGGELTGSFLISSDTLVHLNLPVLNDSVFQIKIYNEDNPPLEITGFSTLQNAERIISYLDTGKLYHLEMTSALTDKPHFDLFNFKDSIRGEIKEIGISDIVNISTIKKKDSEGMRPFWLWPALVFVLIVLGLFTYKLTQDMSKKV